MENEINNIKKQLDSLKDSENCLNKQICKLNDEISEKESVIRNVFSKLNENELRIDILEKKVKESEKINEYLESRLKTVETAIENLTLNFSCDKCDLIFKNESTLIEHTIRDHENNEDKNVPEEEKVSASTAELNNKTDEKLTEDCDKVFQCEICNYKSSSEHGIKIHKTKKHSHFCHFCKQYLPNAAELKNHTFDCRRRFYGSPMRSPVQYRNQFSHRFPPRFPPRSP